jgi:uncharacterized protein YbjQ (UPF0145 family)
MESKGITVTDKKGMFYGAVLAKMVSQLRDIMDDVENNSMMSTDSRNKALAEMQSQLDALSFGASHLQRAYGTAPAVIQGQCVESGTA